MKKYFIEDANYGDSHGGWGAHYASVKFNDGEKSQWLTIGSLDEYPNWYLTERDIMPELVEDKDDEEFDKYSSNSIIGSFGEIDLGETLDDAVDSVKKYPELPEASLIEFLIALFKCPSFTEEEKPAADRMIKDAKNHYADDLGIMLEE